jgi:hypothetical protein
MNTTSYLTEDSALAKSRSSKKNYRFSFSSFQKAIRENSELRKQVEDIVDFGLFEYALRQNSAFIQSVREKAETETIELMMRFTNGVDDYQKLKKMIHRNRIIRTLAIMDRKAQLELMNRFNRLRARV